MKNPSLHSIAGAALLLWTTSIHATGLASCESGPREGWQPQAKLEQMLTEKGWKVHRIKKMAAVTRSTRWTTRASASRPTFIR